ncbi:hypothetical protein GO308_01815 [Sphingomonas sp. SFZ2018-12]|uniref:glycosyltransferase family 4 protein n=1 Tax=Sphingomonas sp. SFZ2018-12 TaxID=2683197 RepID=UPI001F0DE89C|nr:glycosyltransferase family 4 protein [Sphingomonas sp. SFZ2018-12]MCH4891845.1 hypothetical protein [Sphingomonas sp. SFZ2018-12]
MNPASPAPADLPNAGVDTPFARLLARLPRRLRGPGYALLRRPALRAIAADRSTRPLALLATHDLSRSGAPRTVLEIAAPLLEQGYRVIVFSMAEGPMRGAFEELGIPVLIDPTPGATSAYLRDLADRATIALCNTVVTAGFVAAWGDRVPTIWYLHELSLLKDLIDRGRLRLPFARAARVWSGSEISAAIARAGRADVSVFPYGMAPIGEAPPPRTDGRLRIGVFGSVEARKGQDLLADGLELLNPVQLAELDVRVFGRVLDPAFARPVLARAKAQGLFDYGGELDAASCHRAMLDVDAVLVCSREDTLPLVSLDALGCGRVLMLLPGVGTRNWITDNVSGLIAADASGPAVAELLSRALATRARLPEIAAAGRDVFDRHFSQAEFRQRLLAEIAELTGGAGSA